MEPHSSKKRSEGRYRLISSMALVDQVVDRVLFSTWQKTEIKNCMQIAGKSGWSPMPEGFRGVLALGEQVLATDCSAFDWTYPSWLVDLTATIRLEQTRGCSPEYVKTVKARWQEVLGRRCVIKLPDGVIYRQTVQGIMKSGWLLTISGNSMAQELVTIMALKRSRPQAPLPRLWSMGDDVLMQWDGSDSSDLEQAISRLGILQKFSVQSPEFSGFLIKGTLKDPVVDPLYPDKHRFLLAHQNVDQLEEVCTAYGLLYALASPESRAWIDPYIEKYSRWTTHTYRMWALGTLPSGALRLRENIADRVFPF